MVFGQTLNSSSDVIETKSQDLIGAGPLPGLLVTGHTDTEDSHGGHGKQNDQCQNENQTFAYKTSGRHRFS